MKILKKFAALNLATAILVTSMASLSFADSPEIISSEYGMGFEVKNEQNYKPSSRKLIVDKPTSVLGGSLWASWLDGTSFRANYQHASKTHMCTARNDSGLTKSSSWKPKGELAQTYYLNQTLYANRVFANTK